jgi:hypothetical protein
MTHARTYQIVAAILALALTITVALSTTTTRASARTFSFDSMVQQPLPPQFGCAMQRALTGRSFACRESSDR